MGRWSGAVRRGAGLGAMASVALAACQKVDAPTPTPPLAPAAQRAAAEKIAAGFADVCLHTTDALEATRALSARGWPRFGTVWREPNSVFYAAKPSSASPAGLFVNGDRRLGGLAIDQLACVGHYPAEGDGPMVKAIQRRWGEGQERTGRAPPTRAWAFRMTDAGLSPMPIEAAFGGPATALTLRSLRPGEALVFIQVTYNPAYNDVGSIMSVRRPAG